jgi:hypothetical protein
MIFCNLKAWILISLILFNNIMFISNEQEDYEDENDEDYYEEDDDDKNEISINNASKLQFNHDNCYNQSKILKFNNYACVSQSKCCNLIEFIFEGGKFNKENFFFSLYMPRLMNIFFLIMIPFISASLLIGFFLGCVCSHCCRTYSPKYSQVNSSCEQYTTTSRRPYQI